MSLDSLTKQSSAPRTPFRLSAPTLGATTLRILFMLAINTAMLAAIALPIQPYVSPVGPATPWFAWAAMFSWQVIMVLQALAFFRWVDGRQLQELPLAFDTRARQAALWGALLSGGLLAGYVGLTHLTGVTQWSWNTGYAPTATLLASLLTALAGPGEEFLFRGYLLRTLAYHGPRASALVSSVIFAMVHMLTGRVNPLDQLALFLHGYLFAVLAQRSKSLWPGVIIHFVYNGLTSLVWTGDPNTALLAFGGSLGWTKWAFKAAMVIPFLIMTHLLYGRQEERH